MKRRNLIRVLVLLITLVAFFVSEHRPGRIRRGNRRAGRLGTRGQGRSSRRRRDTHHGEW